MRGEYYVINFDAMENLYVLASNRITEWRTQLNEWMTSYTELIGLESFQGTSATSAKTYLQEVHGVLLSAIDQTLTSYQSSFLLYKNWYYSLDTDIHSVIPQETIQAIVSKMQSEMTELDNIADSIQSALSSVSDIYSLSNPTYYTLYSTKNGIQNTLRLRDLKIDNYEDNQYTIANQDIQSELDALQRTIEEYLENGTYIGSYVSGDLAYNTSVQTLYNKVEVSAARVESQQIELEAAIDQQTEVYAQMQEEYEQAYQEACEARKDQGTAEMIMGGLAIVLGTVVIVGTAGLATPIVVVAGISGGCTIAYGYSNMLEGADEYYYGSIGDLTTEAFNPLRDTVFCGNQELYDAWGSLSMTIASLCIPVGTATAGMSGLGNIAKAGIKTVGKELIEDKIYDEISETATNYLADKYDLNATQTTLLNVGIKMN